MEIKKSLYINKTMFIYCFVSLLFTHLLSAQNIVINEILASNTTVIKDEDGSYEDWIELYNNNSTEINLLDFSLTDDATNLNKWKFPNVSIAPGQYLLVWCSDKNRTNPANPLHTNFKISSSGEVITLTNSQGSTIDSAVFNTIPKNISYGRSPNGFGNFVYFTNVTPNKANATEGYTEILNPPVFSHESGFSTQEFDLILSSNEIDATILYTLDGSEPNLSNLGGTTYSYKNQYPENIGDTSGGLLNNSFTTLQYNNPILIKDKSSLPNKIANISSTFQKTPLYIPDNPLFKSSVVKAKLIKSGFLDSKTITKTYFISPKGVNRFSLPIVSLSLDEDQFFDYNNGIYVAGIDGDNWRIKNPTVETKYLEGIGNYYRSGRENEKMANLSYFVNGVEVLNQNVGLSIHGGITKTFESKSITIEAREEYGEADLDYKFFNDLPYESFTSLVLRNSGGDFRNTMFRDALNQQICKSLIPDKESYQPTVTFINGEFWGILNLRDRYTNDYFKRVYNANKIDFLRNNASINEGDNINYKAMTVYVSSNSLANPENYNYIKTQIDTENFTDYFISNIFLQNEDWPNTNIEYWRNKIDQFNPDATYGLDGRWRWVFHDSDNSMSFVSGNYNSNTLAVATSVNTTNVNPEYATLLLRKLIENTEFKTNFINRFADLLNTSFLPSRTTSILESMKAVIYPTIPEHIERWKSPAKLSRYDTAINYELDFLNQRPNLQRNHIRDVFSINSNINATLDVSNPSHGYVKMNTINIKEGTDGIAANPYPWTGIYFSNIPVKIKAIAKPGYVFSHWTGASTSTNPEITLTADTNFSVTAVFEQNAVATSQPIYYWMMNSDLPNNQPLESMTTTYKTGSTNGTIQYQSCLIGYPFISTDINWRKASMERRNLPTDVNYIAEANNNSVYDPLIMKGLQIKEPFHHSDGQGGTLDNTLIFSIPSTGYKDIKFSFAAINELTNVTAISLDYSLNAGTPIFQVTSSFPITDAYQLFEYDLSTIVGANNNPDLKIRMRFTGKNMTADTGARITFNNIAVHGSQNTLDVVDKTSLQFSVYPNPFSDVVNIIGSNDVNSTYKVFTIDGKLIKQGNLENSQIYLHDISKGLYLLQLNSDGKTETKKIIKK